MTSKQLNSAINSVVDLILFRIELGFNDELVVDGQALVNQLVANTRIIEAEFVNSSYLWRRWEASRRVWVSFWPTVTFPIPEPRPRGVAQAATAENPKTTTVLTRRLVVKVENGTYQTTRISGTVNNYHAPPPMNISAAGLLLRDSMLQCWEQRRKRFYDLQLPMNSSGIPYQGQLVGSQGYSAVIGRDGTHASGASAIFDNEIVFHAEKVPNLASSTSHNTLVWGEFHNTIHARQSNMSMEVMDQVGRFLTWWKENPEFINSGGLVVYRRLNEAAVLWRDQVLGLRVLMTSFLPNPTTIQAGFARTPTRIPTTKSANVNQSQPVTTTCTDFGPPQPPNSDPISVTILQPFTSDRNVVGKSQMLSTKTTTTGATGRDKKVVAEVQPLSISAFNNTQTTNLSDPAVEHSKPGPKAISTETETTSSLERATTLGNAGRITLEKEEKACGSRMQVGDRNMEWEITAQRVMNRFGGVKISSKWLFEIIRDALASDGVDVCNMTFEDN